MPRSLEVAVTPEVADLLVARIGSLQGVLGLARQRGASVRPAGDLVVVQTTNDAARAVFEILDELGVTRDGSITTNAPRALITAERDWADTESNETVWEEMAFLLREDTNVRFNYLAMMMLAGAVAGAGLWADTVHVVVGAMLIAPAFEPLVRIPFGLVAGPRGLASRGLVAVGAGYAMVFMGALVSVALLRVIDGDADPNPAARSWVLYWSSFSPAGLTASLFGALAGAFVVCGLRAVLTTGVMIALALIPSVCVVAMATLAGDVALAAGGVARWSVDAGLVVACTAAVLSAKQLLFHRRRVP